MSVEFADTVNDPTPQNPAAGPSTGSWAHHSTGDSGGSFPEMDVDADLERVSVIESLCMWCHEQGITKLLLTRIPYFRDIVVMSFECPHCNTRTAEVQPANELAPKAVRTTLRVDISDAVATRADLNRQVIKSETCRVLVPEADFEIPANDKRGDINTVEGMLSNVADSLEAGQANRELSEPEKAAKIQLVIEQFRKFAAGSEPFTLVLDDLAGNSFLENPAAPGPDPRVKTTYYERTDEQTLALGYAVEENKSEMESMQVIKGEEAARKIKELVKSKAAAGSKTSAASSASASAASASSSSDMPHEITGRGVSVAPQSLASLDTYFNVSDRSAIMQGPCSACGLECDTRMCVTDVPHFKDVVLLVTSCDACGYRDAEVKPMGQVSKLGRRITLRVESVDDLKRDLLKSDTASCEIPELELELLAGTLGGKYTTLEGMLEDIRAQLERVQPFARGDSSQAAQRTAMGTFMERLAALPSVASPWTFILDDPLGNVFIFSPLGAADPQITTSRYERTHEQNEELGLNDINVDHYLSEEQQKEMDAEMAEEARIKALEDEMASAASAQGSKSASEEQKAQLAELKKGKIGGNISVEHDVDDTSATNQPAGKSEGAISNAPASSPYDKTG